ncbi:MAG: hypothetical protein EXS13_02845 [Planctomycetes bacterium]|nr:hypothetical protein [Planctomycetota bacterium]
MMRSNLRLDAERATATCLRGVLLTAALALAACAAAGADALVDEDAEQPSIAGCERALEAARAEFDKCAVDLVAQQRAAIAAAGEAQDELADAQRARAAFERSRPLAQRKAALEVDTARTALAENEEELVQLELMYAEQDLADKTRELVLARTRRRLEQSRAELALAIDQLALQAAVAHPAEQATLDAAVEAKQRAVDGAAAGSLAASRGQQIAELKARHAVADAEEALAKARAALEKSRESSPGDRK